MKTIRSLGMIYSRTKVRTTLDRLTFSPTGDTEGNRNCRSPEANTVPGS